MQRNQNRHMGSFDELPLYHYPGRWCSQTIKRSYNTFGIYRASKTACPLNCPSFIPTSRGQGGMWGRKTGWSSRSQKKGGGGLFFNTELLESAHKQFDRTETRATKPKSPLEHFRQKHLETSWRCVNTSKLFFAVVGLDYSSEQSRSDSLWGLRSFP